MIDRLPKSQLDRDPVVKPGGDVTTVEALGCRCQAEKLLWIESCEQPVVGVGRRVMELVHDENVERGWVDLFEPVLWSDWTIAKTWRPSATWPPP